MKSQTPMTNVQSNPNSLKPKAKYDLGERTAKYAEEIIDFCKILPNSPIATPIISQLVRSGTSIGANYSEADNASSKKDFINKIYICLKETNETKYWLRQAAHACPNNADHGRRLWKEAQELNLILATIIKRTKNPAKK